MQGVPQLPEAVVEVTDLEVDYEDEWWRVRAEVKGISRTDEDDDKDDEGAYCGEQSVG